MLKKLSIIIAIICSLNFAFLSINAFSLTYESKKADEKALTLIRSALAAMGGENKIRALESVKIKGIGHAYAVEQSERPEGPFIVAYRQIEELRDLNNQRLKRTTEIKQVQVPDWMTQGLTVADGFAALEFGGRSFPGNGFQVSEAKQMFALAPERIFLTALEAADLRLDKDVMMQSVSQHVLKFTWEKIPVTIYLNANTNLPTAVETLSAEPYSHFWTIWGDFTTRTYYTLWTLEPGGIRYPRQWDVEKTGYTFESFTVTDLKLNEPASDDIFKISDEAKKAFAANTPVKIDDLPLGVPNRPAVELAPGVIKVPGRWDIAYVRQTDGIVIIESPISSGYSVKVLDEAKKRFPNEKIKAVITTSDAFPHFGGVREYAAQNIPIYILDANRPLIERVLSAPHKFYPDNLERNPRKAGLKIISQKTVLGNGANRMEIYPFRTETGERMLMLYFPEHKLLYSSDLIQPMRNGGFFSPQYLSEVMDAVRRENLTVENTFGMHLDKTEWSKVTDFVAAQTSETQK